MATATPSMRRRRLPFVMPFPPALLATLAAAPGCGAGQPDAAAALEASFPGRSADVLGAGAGFARTAAGFVGGSPTGPGLGVELPANGAGAVVFHVPGAAPVSVFEIGAAGEARAVDRAVTYARAGGTSFWTVVPGGAEEWLRLAPGAARDGEPAAVWEIPGATLLQRGESIEVRAPGARLWVTAPAAFAEGGTPVPARLRVRANNAIELFVDAGGRGVLVDPMWMMVGPLPGPFENHVAAALTSGGVLVAGGDPGVGTAFEQAALYDPTAKTWAATAAMSVARDDHTATTLGSGKVLVAGGVDNGFNDDIDVEVFDPGAVAWTTTAMPNPHAGHTATLLGDGTVLLAGGYHSNSGFTIGQNNADLYDPTLGVGGGFGPTTLMNNARYYHAACLLHDGKVLASGGRPGAAAPFTSSELYDPATKTWKLTAGSLAVTRVDHQCVTLDDGTVLVAGGDDNAGTTYASAEIYDPTTETWSTTGSMAHPRTFFQMSEIPGGQVVAVGGDDGTGKAQATTEIYDPTTKTWSPGPPMVSPREAFTATLLGNTLLASGGWNGNAVTPTSELIVFGLPNGASCTVDPVCASGSCTTGVCCDSACTGACMACTAALKGSGTDGTCGPVAKGTNPGNACTYEGPSTCGTTGSCDGNGACATYPDGTVCLETMPCIVAVCSGGKCGGPNKLDGSPCPGGICIAGDCVPDPSATTSSSTGGSGSTSSSTGSGGSPTTTAGTGGGGGQGGRAAASATVEGSGCAVAAPGRRSLSAGMIAAALALLAVLRRRMGRLARAAAPLTGPPIPGRRAS